MRIKVFKAGSMKQAMEQVKEELGEDAVILHTKKYNEGGILGYNAKEIVEVTAAVEEVPAAARAERPAPREMVLPPVRPQNVLKRYQTDGTAEGVRALEGGESPIPAPAFSDVLEAVLPVKESVQAPQQTRKVEGMRGAQHASAERAKIHKLEDELAQMKALLAQVMSKDSSDKVITLQEALRRQEVTPEILQHMAATLKAGEPLIDSREVLAKRVLSGYLAETINFSQGISLGPKGHRVVALIGPTGVGKTTTLAKIAARFVLEHGVQAALITADTYRISAVEQLKTYSDIIGLPLEIVYSPQELSKALRKYKEKELILIDTAGRSQHNEYQMQELQEFLAVNAKIEKHLVLSATTKSRDAEDILEKFSVCDPDCVIFTKMDETSAVGLILNLLHEREIALSFLTMGQSVPDDILPATAENLTELLLR